MAQTKVYTAKNKPFKLDCGHMVRIGDSFVVTKVFSCELDAKRVGFKKVEPPPPQK